MAVKTQQKPVGVSDPPEPPLAPAAPPLPEVVPTHTPAQQAAIAAEPPLTPEQATSMITLDSAPPPAPEGGAAPVPQTQLARQVRSNVQTAMAAEAPPAAPVDGEDPSTETPSAAPVSREELQAQAIQGSREPMSEALANRMLDVRLENDRLQEEERQRRMAAQRAEADVKEIAERPDGPALDAGFLDWVAMLFAGGLGGLTGDPTATAQTINTVIDRNIRKMAANKDSELGAAEARLQDRQAALDAVRARQWRAVGQLAEAQNQLGIWDAQTAGQLAAVKPMAELQARDAQDRAVAAQAAALQKVQMAGLEAQAKARGTALGKASVAPATGPLPGPAIYREGRLLGATAKDVDEFRNRDMLYDGRNVKLRTVAHGAERVAQTRALIESLAADGIQPGVSGFKQFGSRTKEILRTLGIGGFDDPKRQNFDRIVATLITDLGKSYGGVMTESDVKRAEQALGTSPQQFLSFLDDKLNTLRFELTEEAQAVPIESEQGLVPLLKFMAPNAFGDAAVPYRDQ